MMPFLIALIVSTIYTGLAALGVIFAGWAPVVIPAIFIATFITMFFIMGMCKAARKQWNSLDEVAEDEADGGKPDPE